MKADNVWLSNIIRLISRRKEIAIDSSIISVIQQRKTIFSSEKERRQLKSWENLFRRFSRSVFVSNRLTSTTKGKRNKKQFEICQTSSFCSLIIQSGLCFSLSRWWVDETMFDLLAFDENIIRTRKQDEKREQRRANHFDFIRHFSSNIFMVINKIQWIEKERWKELTAIITRFYLFLLLSKKETYLDRTFENTHFHVRFVQLLRLDLRETRLRSILSRSTNWRDE